MNVRAFLGMTGYYCQFLPALRSVAASMPDLMKSAAPTRVNWTEECKQVIQQLKQQLASQPVLIIPDYDTPFVLQTDASDWGIGGVLSQVDDASGEERTLAFFSRKRKPPSKQIKGCCTLNTLPVCSVQVL